MEHIININPVVESLVHDKEVCWIFDFTTNQFMLNTSSENYNSCLPKYNGVVMAHTHPYRRDSHKMLGIEINYYPSAEDILYPASHNDNLFNLIVTPIGVYISSFDSSIPIKDYI